jgi:L-lactate dehydrogenase complex protein LldG
MKRVNSGDVIPERPSFQVMQRESQSSQQLSQQFESMISKVKGEVIRTSQDDLEEIIQAVLEKKGIKRLLLSPESPYTESFGSLLDEIRLYDEAIENWKDILFNDIDASITSTLGGVAETGTLVLWPSVAEPRLMSLVPPIHIAILYECQMQPTFWHFLHHHKWSEGMPTNALLISGPSKTADIEQTLAYGVHGPKELVVVLVAE